jgi:formamidopyrimidine-DNA glycosylase
MPELPELEYIVSVLERTLPGRDIVGVRVKNPVVLRLAVKGPPGEVCRGQRFQSCHRHGHFLRFAVGDAYDLIINPMLAGQLRLAGSGERDEASLCLAVEMNGRLELRYLDDKQMGKVYLVPAGDHRSIPGYDDVGIEPLSPEFTGERLRTLLRGRRDQVRAFLLDKAAVAAIGNAYADEILWAARIHPKTGCRGLTVEDVVRLHAAIREVLSGAVQEVARRAAPIEVKVRDFLRVRNRKGQPCSRCNTPIRVEGVRGFDAFYCPTCQPNRPDVRLGRRQLVDWSRLVPPVKEGDRHGMGEDKG